jgi:hypothetical protein
MCKPERGLHNNENVVEIETDKNLIDLVKEIKMTEAEWYFLQNEDILY